MNNISLSLSRFLFPGELFSPVGFFLWFQGKLESIFQFVCVLSWGFWMAKQTMCRQDLLAPSSLCQATRPWFLPQYYNPRQHVQLSPELLEGKVLPQTLTQLSTCSTLSDFLHSGLGICWLLEIHSIFPPCSQWSIQGPPASVHWALFVNLSGEHWPTSFTIECLVKLKLLQRWLAFSALHHGCFLG